MISKHLLFSMGFICFAWASQVDSTAFAEEDSATKVSSAMLPITRNNNLASGLNFGVYQTTSDSAGRKLAAFQSDSNGHWVLPKVTVSEDQKRNHVPLMLKTPHGNIRIKLSVLVDGFSPERATENLLDQVIKGAGDEASKAEKDLPTTLPQSVPAEEPKTESEETTVAPKAFQRDSVLTKLERLVCATNAEAADREELHWMLDQWRPGPLWLIARDSVSPPQTIPGRWVTWMDSDSDAMLRKSEWEGLANRIRRLDSNRDRIVTLAELDEHLKRNSRRHQSSAPHLDWGLAWDMDADSKTTEICEAVEINVQVRSPGVIDQVASTVDQFLNTKVAKTIGSQVSVRTKTNSVSAIPGGVLTKITNDSTIPSIQLTIHGYVNKNLTRVSSCQFSIAAKVDRNPIWNVIDTNGDGRLVEVEQRNAANRIAQLDLNQDAMVSPLEWPLTYHLVICQGNDAAEQLKTLTPRVHNIETETSAAPIPDWFTGMDSNQDGSLNRGEFLGSTNQFNNYDKNHDGLLTPSETTTPETNSIDSIQE
jgi:hypothetical protein